MEAFVEEQNQGSTDSNTEARTLLARIQDALAAVPGLTLLSDVLLSEVAQTMLGLLQNLLTRPAEPEAVALAYSQTFGALAEAVNRDDLPRLADAWQSYLAAYLIDDRNPWSSQVERVGQARVSQNLRSQARRDLRILQRFFALEAQDILLAVESIVSPEMPVLRNTWLPWLDLAPVVDEEESANARDLLASELARASDWASLVEPLEAYWARALRLVIMFCPGRQASAVWSVLLILTPFVWPVWFLRIASRPVSKQISSVF